MKLLLSPLIAIAFATPAFAQVDHSKMDHSEMEHSQMEHGQAHVHKGHDQVEMDTMSDAASANNTALALAAEPSLMTALSAGGTPIVASVLGAVCDFCALAMNKTFSKRDEVAAVHVSLDEKTLNLILNPGSEMDDETLRSLVKKAGYKVDVIDRNPVLPAT